MLLAAAVPDAACGCTTDDSTYETVPSSDNFQTIVSNYIEHEAGDLATSRNLYGNTINCWDVSEVTNMYYAFLEQGSFNERLDCWKTSKVTKMYDMFARASGFNQDISA